jgi:tetratricopeptide (TPR) repeat protein
MHRPAGEIGLLRAFELYQEAIALDGEFAEAYAGRAHAALFLWRYAYDMTLPGSVARQALYEAAGRALTLNPELPRARAVLAEAQSVDGEHYAAIAPPAWRSSSARAPPRRMPRSPRCWPMPASLGRRWRRRKTALRLNPKPPAGVLLTAGLALLLDGRYDRAIEALEQARALAPGLNEPIEFLATAYAQAHPDDTTPLRGRQQACSMLLRMQAQQAVAVRRRTATISSFVAGGRMLSGAEMHHGERMPRRPSRRHRSGKRLAWPCLR